MRRSRFLTDPGNNGKVKSTSRMKLNELLKHPFVLFFMGFILSGVIGGIISRYYENLDFERSMEFRRVEYAIQIVRPAADVLARASALVEGIENEDSEVQLEDILSAYRTARTNWKAQLNQANILGFTLISRRTDPVEKYMDLWNSAQLIGALIEDVDFNLEPIHQCVMEVMRLGRNDRQRGINNCQFRPSRKAKVHDDPRLQHLISISKECLAKAQVILSLVSAGDDIYGWLDTDYCRARNEPPEKPENPSNPGADLPGPKEDPTLTVEWQEFWQKLFDPKTYLPD